MPTAVKPPPPVRPPALRGTAGLVFFRLKPIRFGLGDGSQKRGQLLTRIREGDEPPPFNAEAWNATGGKGRWSEEFGGRWVCVDGRKLVWEWDQ